MQHLPAAVLLAVLALTTTLANGHAALICPTPLSSSSGEKTYPCGYDYFNKFGTTVPWATVAPGKLTVSWTETIDHAGAPFRLALSLGGDCRYEQTVLVDHIPHCDSPCPFGPIPRTYYWNVDIPNVDTISNGGTPASLQLLQIMTDKLSGSPASCNTLGNVDPASCFSVYHSCARLRISGTVAPTAFTYTYTPTPGLPNPVPNSWAKGEVGTWGADGWLVGQDKTIYQRPAACSPGPALTNAAFPPNCSACNYPPTCGTAAISAPTTTIGGPTSGTTAGATGGSSSGSAGATQARKERKVGEMNAGLFAAAILTTIAFAAIVAAFVFVKRPSHAATAVPNDAAKGDVGAERL